MTKKEEEGQKSDKVRTLYTEKKKPLFQLNSKEDIEKFAALVEYLGNFEYFNEKNNTIVEIYYGEDNQLYASFEVIYKIENLSEFIEEQKIYINETLKEFNNQKNQKK